MLTTSSLVNFLAFRDEFRSEFSIDGRLVDMTVQPIDAPENIAAGSYISMKAMTIKNYSYPMPSTFGRGE